MTLNVYCDVKSGSSGTGDNACAGRAVVPALFLTSDPSTGGEGCARSPWRRFASSGPCREAVMSHDIRSGVTRPNSVVGWPALRGRGLIAREVYRKNCQRQALPCKERDKTYRASLLGAGDLRSGGVFG